MESDRTSSSAQPQGARSGDQQRVFYALWPDAAAADALDALAQRVAVEARGRATVGQRLHLTLAFVGNVDVEDVARLVTIASDVASRAAPFTLALDRVGAFRDAGIVWIGASETPVALRQLAAHMQHGLAENGFPVDERTFKAHITLARRCERRPGTAQVPAIAWTVDTITLIASELTRGGPHYFELARCSIGQSPRNLSENS